MRGACGAALFGRTGFGGRGPPCPLVTMTRFELALPYECVGAGRCVPAEAGAGVCLDGSPPALYYVAAKSAAHNASWVVMLQGGGWCESSGQCYNRSVGAGGQSGDLGSSAVLHQ